MVLSCEQIAEQNYNINTGSKYFAMVKQFKCLGTAVTNEEYIEIKIKSILKSRNSCYHSMQGRLSSRLL
jgi:hypothetical protein